MARAWIDGRAAALEDAVAKAAELLAESRCPLVAGLGTDVAGARAAIMLAERIGAAIDHMHSDVVLRDLAVIREAGIMLTTPSEARLRADTLLLVGPGPTDSWPDLHAWPQPAPEENNTDRSRTVVRLCPGRGIASPKRNEQITVIGRDTDQLPALLAALRARLAGRPIGKAAVPSKSIDALAKLLKAARFGVAVWSAAELDPLLIEMLCGMIDDLNAETRFAGFSLAPADNATGVLQACGWMTGFPVRTGFGRGYPEHDPWRFDGNRLVASREADCVLWISAYRAAAPMWDEGPPVIALTTGDAELRGRLAVQIAVGHPGVDHDSVEHQPAIGTLVAVPATRPSDAISVTDALQRIIATFSAAGASA
jgi:formylmethanofuran dehydrogenase subunit B